MTADRTCTVASRDATQPALDVQRIRKDFPILHQEINGKPLVYLDNVATTQKPQSVIDTLSHYYANDNANIHRAVHELGVRATDSYERARGTVQRFINAARPEEIIFVRGTTEAINLVAQTYGRRQLQAGDEILISAMEHHSNIVPWQMLCEQVGATLRVVPIDDDGELCFDEYEKLLGPRTKLVAITHISNSIGTVNPVREIIDRAHDQGIPVLLDGAQGVPHAKVDVQSLDCDFYAFSGHKVFGPTGVGALYGKFDLLDAMPPYQGGGDMIKSVTFEETTYNDLPYRLEAGTPNIAAGLGFAAALDYVSSVGIERIAAHERDLLDYAGKAIGEIPEVKLIGTAKNRAAVLSFVVKDIHPHDLGTILDQQGVAVRTGHHCAQPVMDHFGVPATVRASFAFYNTREEADALVDGVRRAIKMFAS